MRRAILILIVLAVPVLTHAATLKVPSQYPNIQDAIDAAVNGDTVLVAPGTYVENIDFIGKAITVTSSDGAEVTVIDGGQPANPDFGSVVTFQNGEGLYSILEGFTLTNGTGTYYNIWWPTHCGGGIFCKNSSPIIMSNTFSYNSAEIGGGMCNTDYSSPTVINCTFSVNTAESHGGGMANWPSNPTVINCTFSGNTADDWGAGMYNDGSGSILINCTFSGNRAYNGGVMFNNCSDPKLTNCTLFGNFDWQLGKGVIFNWFSNPTVTNCILWNYAANEIYNENNSVPTVTYSNVQGGYPGIGNIDTDPLFVSGPKGFCYLSQVTTGQPIDSPCVDTGSALASSLGMDIYWTRTDGVPDSGIVDMGFHYGDFLFPALQTDTFTILIGTGGDADFLLLAGSGNANRNYILLGSFTGTDPGTPLPGGTATLPLNWDIFTNLVIDLINTPIFNNFMGTLNATGSEEAKFDTLGPVPACAGMTLRFAYALNGPWGFVSNPVGIIIR